MAFYNDISKYYDYIFPVTEDTLSFIKSIGGNPPKAVLDVACGTGGYAVELEKEGFDLTAVDLDSSMIEGLRQKTKTSFSKIKFLQSDMLELNKKFDQETFDVIYCIGNSVVHLDSLDEIKKFFTAVRQLLKKDGTFVFQIINFDRVISKSVKSLPTIINDEVPLKFERYYSLDKEKNKIIFKTILSVEDKSMENQIYLTPLYKEEAVSLLEEAGFKEIRTYGDFYKNDFTEDESYVLVIEAK